MQLPRVIPAGQIGALRTPPRPVRWDAPVVAKPRPSSRKPDYAEFLRRHNAAARRADDGGAFPAAPIPFDAALREQNVQARRAESRAEAGAAFAHPTDRHAPAHARRDAFEPDACSHPAAPDRAAASASRPIVPPPPPPASVPLSPVAAAYRLVLPLARGSIIDVLA